MQIEHARDLCAAFREGGPAGEVDINTAVWRLLKQYRYPAQALTALAALLESEYVDWSWSARGEMIRVASQVHWHEAARREIDGAVHVVPAVRQSPEAGLATSRVLGWLAALALLAVLLCVGTWVRGWTVTW